MQKRAVRRKQNPSPQTARQPRLEARQVRHDVYRQHILATAEQVFAERGFESSKLQEISDRVGLSMGTIYALFPSKADLLQAILDKHGGVFVREHRERGGSQFRTRLFQTGQHLRDRQGEACAFPGRHDARVLFRHGNDLLLKRQDHSGEGHDGNNDSRHHTRGEMNPEKNGTESHAGNRFIRASGDRQPTYNSAHCRRRL